MQAAATEFGIDDIRTKDQADSFHYPGRFFNDHAKRREPPTAALFPESTSGGYGPLLPRGNFHMPCEWVAA